MPVGTSARVGRGLLFSCALLSVALRIRPAGADQPSVQDNGAVAQARALFAEAVRQEDAGNFSEALRMFKGVRAVKDTPAVEYRMGTCHEGMHSAHEAYMAYQRSVRLGGDDRRAAEVVNSARDRMEALSAHVARLRVLLPSEAPAGLAVRVDGSTLPSEDLGVVLALEPGLHAVTVTAPARSSWQSDVVLAEGTEVSIAPALPPPRADAPGMATTSTDSSKPGSDRARDEPRTHGTPRTTAGWIAVGVGGALLAGSAVSLALRAMDIAALNRDCPKGACPAGADRAGLQATRSRALVEGPLAVTLGGGAALALAAGAYLLLIAPPRAATGANSSIAWLPLVGEHATGWAVSGSF